MWATASRQNLSTSVAHKPLYVIGRLKRKRIFIKMSLAKLNIDKGDNKI
jgi:hypothetical protein